MIEVSGWMIAIIGFAVLLDLLIGDPRWLPHPVVAIGKLISFLECKWNHGSSRKVKGMALVITVVGGVYLLTLLVLKAAYTAHWFVGMFTEAMLISTTIAIKGLKDAAKEVLRPLKEGDLEGARQALGMIVGRDTASLSEPEIVRGTVESVAENTVDGITAPLFFVFIGGAPLALAYRAVNTLDSMVGYRNERYAQFGWASAKLDDMANWIPSRITAFCMATASVIYHPRAMTDGIRIALRDAWKHPSPNSGWPEAVTAGALGVQLGGVNYYQGVRSERARLGEAKRSLQAVDITRTIRIMHGGWILFFLLVGKTYLAVLFFIQ